MPRGTRHQLVGLLLRLGDGLFLDVPGGGAWRLDLGCRAALRTGLLVGTRARVDGTRDGFDLLALHRIDRAR